MPTRKVKCSQCERTYSIDHTRYPQKGGKVACKVCGGVVRVPPIALTDENQGNIRVIVCPNCAQRYRVPEHRIPTSRNSVTCKVCGCDMPLRENTALPDVEALSELAEAQESEDGYAYEGASEESIGDFWDTYRWWVIGGGASVVLLVVLVLCITLSARSPSKSGKALANVTEDATQAVKESASNVQTERPMGSIEPYAMASFNVSRIVEDFADLSDLPVETSMGLGLLAQTGLVRASAYLFPNAKTLILPGVVLEFDSPATPQAMVSDQGPVGAFLTPESESTYRLNRSALTSAVAMAEGTEDSTGSGALDLTALPLEQYVVWLHGSRAVLAPEEIVNHLMQDPDALNKTGVRLGLAGMSSVDSWAEFFSFVPESIHTRWKDAVLQVLENHIRDEHEMEGMRFVVDLVEEQVTSGLSYVSHISALAAVLSSRGGHRTQVFTLHFRDATVAQRFLRSLSEPEDTPLFNSQLGKQFARKILTATWLQRTTSFKGRTLTVNVEWSATRDPNMLGVFMKPSIASEDPMPDLAVVNEMQEDEADFVDYEPSTVTEVTPPGQAPPEEKNNLPFVKSLDKEQLKSQLKMLLSREAVWPDHYWESSGSMDLDIEPGRFANMDFAVVDCHVIKVVDPQGRTVKHEPFSKPKRVRLGDTVSHLEFKMAPDTKKEQLGQATLEFHIKVPSKIDTVLLTPKDIGQTRQVGSATVTLRKFQNVGLLCETDGTMLCQYGLSADGRRVGEIYRGQAFQFNESIQQVQVAVVQDTLDMSFQTDVDLNQGEDYRLTGKPEIPKRNKYTDAPLPGSRGDGRFDVSQGSVVWSQYQRQGQYGHSLRLKLPESVVVTETNWQVFGVSGRQKHVIQGSTMGAFFQRNPLVFTSLNPTGSSPESMSGRVEIDLATEVHQYDIPLDGTRKTLRLKLDNHKSVRVAVDKNAVTYDMTQVPVLEVAAFDQAGRRFSKSNALSLENGNRTVYFWGIPARIVLCVAMKTEERTVLFDIGRETDRGGKAILVEPTNVQTARGQSASILPVPPEHEAIASALKGVYDQRIKRASLYGEDLAGLYYLPNRQVDHMRLIDEAIAHSDPKGQGRFGYSVVPYEGYLFTVLPRARMMRRNVQTLLRSSGVRVIYNGQRSVALPVRHLPDVVAWPAEGTGMSYVMTREGLYEKPVTGPLDVLPDILAQDGWIRVE